MEYTSKGQGMTQTQGVGQLLGLGECLLDTLEGLVGIAQVPQERRDYAPAAHSRTDPGIEECEGMVLLRIIQSYPLLQVLSACHKLSRPQQGLPQHLMGHQKERRVLDRLCQSEQLLPEF